MPTLTRFALILTILGTAAYAAMLALATLVVPEPRDIVVAVPLDHLGAHPRSAAHDARSEAASLEAMRRKQLATELESLQLGAAHN